MVMEARFWKRNPLLIGLLALLTILTPLSWEPPSAAAATTVSLPGQVEAENWSAMNGVQTEATSDAGGGLNVGWIDAGDWMDYAVNVQTAGTYTVDFRVASPNSGQQLQLRNAGGTVLATANVPNTGGWQNWATVSVSASLGAGAQTLRLYAVTTGFNVNWVRFTAAAPTPTPTPTPGTIVSGGIYKLINPNSGKALDVASAGTADGTNVQIWADNGTAAQQWQTNKNSDGTYTLINVGSGKALDVAAAGTADGTNVQIYTSNGTGAQKWSINSNGDGTYLLLNQNAGKALDVVNAGTADGTNVQIWGNTATVARKWQLIQASSPTPTPTVTPTPTPGTAPDFGPNVKIFSPSMSASSIQSQLNSVFSQQESNQFGTNRYALVFKPGTYNVDVNVGFYTQVLGLGMSPDDVTINGAVHAEADWFQGNATQNFWRATENLSVTPSGGTNRWAVSQAAPFRRMHIRGNLALDDGGWSSGGFISDSKIDNQVNSGGQQQWFSRNSQFGNWAGSNWNMVFVGVNGAPSGASWPNPPHTVVGQTPVVREKPFLTIDSAGNYSVFVPALTTNTQGTTWVNGATAGQSIPINQFYIAKQGVDNAATINAALSQGKNLLFTPGIYHLNDTIRVTQANTVVLGLGLATLIPDNGVNAMSIADVDGVKVAGLLFDAGPANSQILLEVGPTGSSASHAANPTSLHDLFFRVGGAAVGKADVSLKINSNNVIGDHFWIWRADHSYGVGWNTNTTKNGLIVNGANVTIYGLFVEHYHQYQTLWNGNGGRVYFYQSEIPYDVPNQSSWMNGSVNGYASYKVASSVTSHEAWGVGIYCYFSSNPSVKLQSAIEAPNVSGVKFHNMTTVSLGGTGEITHILNNIGNAANSGGTVQRLAQ